MAQIQVSRDILVEDAVFILQCLRQNQRGGRDNGLPDVQETLANSVALDLADYVSFLRRFGYVEVDAQKAALRVTDEGDLAAVGKTGQKIFRDIGEHFAPMLAAGRVELADEGDAFADLLRSAGLGQDAPTPAPAKTEAAARFELIAVRAPRLAAVAGELGQGALARVREVRVGALQARGALKELKPIHALLPWLSAEELSRRIRAQAEGQAALAHPFALPVLDLLEPEAAQAGAELPRILSPLAAGGSLRSRLAREKQLPLADALRLCAQAALALGHAHAGGRVHGALKPENALLDARGNLLLSDFGIAGLVQLPEAPAGTQLRVVVELGPEAYRAPETSALRAPTPAADSFALGALLYEALAGGAPHSGSPAPSLCRSDCPRAIDDLVEALLADAQADRPSMADAAARLMALLGSAPLLHA